jgi:hypothetical protein
LKTLVRIHRYLSCFVAPAMLFFAISGAWQAFRLHETRKDGSYKAPAVMQRLSDIHKAEDLSGTRGTIVKAGQVLFAVAFAVTAVIGIVMALRIARPVWLVWLTLAAGVMLPALLVLVVQAGKGP